MGSVKDMIILEEATRERTGVGRFVFSDRYSVFDWGEMPDLIEGKGQALCLVTAYFFEELENRGIRTHYLGLVEEEKVVELSDLKKPSKVLQFKVVRVIRPSKRANGYDYSTYAGEKGCFLLPLEVIYRNSLPEGSSVFKRLREGSLTLEDIGLEEMPAPGQVLPRPILDVSTKLESSDRYLSWDEARAISGLSPEEITRLKELTLLVNSLITEKAEGLGLLHEDGKVEFAFDPQRELMLVDALGTPDECRFSYQGIPVSKEVARIHYRRTSWYRDVERAKEEEPVHWKERVVSRPEPLPSELRRAISHLYMSFANQVTGREWFDCPPLPEVLGKIKEYLQP
jgi:phosphoribosylaminoimidazole-succinocarboxamide synthase